MRNEIQRHGNTAGTKYRCTLGIVQQRMLFLLCFCCWSKAPQMTLLLWNTASKYRSSIFSVKIQILITYNLLVPNPGRCRPLHCKAHQSSYKHVKRITTLWYWTHRQTAVCMCLRVNEYWISNLLTCGQHTCFNFAIRLCDTMLVWKLEGSVWLQRPERRCSSSPSY